MNSKLVEWSEGLPSTPRERILRSWGTMFVSRNARFSGDVGPTNLCKLKTMKENTG